MLDFAVFLIVVLAIMSALWDMQLVQRFWKWMK